MDSTKLCCHSREVVIIMSYSTSSNKLDDREAESQVWDGCGFFSTAKLKAW